MVMEQFCVLIMEGAAQFNNKKQRTYTHTSCQCQLPGFDVVL